MAGQLAADLDDRVILARLADLATRRGFSLVRADDSRVASDAEAPTAIVVDLGSPGAVDRIVAYRR